MENIHEENVEITEATEIVEAVEAKQDTCQVEDATVRSEKKKGKKIPKAIWISAVAAIAVIAIVVSVVGALSNTYKTPLNLEYDLLNTRECHDLVAAGIALCNGFSEKEINDIIDISKEIDGFEDGEEYLQELFQEEVEFNEYEYGEDYKFSYRIEDKEELDSDDLKEVRNEFRTAAKGLKEVIEEADDYDSDDWEDMADDLGISKSKAKKLVKALEALYEKWKNVDVSEGYELSIIQIIEGEELEEPEESEKTVHVYKIDGRWVSESVFYIFGSLPLF